MAKSTVDAMNAGGQPGDVPVFYPSPRPQRSTRAMLIDSVADILAERSKSDANFFADLCVALNERSCALYANKNGFVGIEPIEKPRNYAERCLEMSQEQPDGNSTEV